MTPITPERVEELREYVRTGRLLVTGDPADVSALINSLDEHSALKAEVSDQKKALDLCGYIIEPIRNERDALKGENERLRTAAPIANVQLSGDGEYWKACAEKAEAENERLRADKESLRRLLRDALTSAQDKESELAKQAPLIQAVMGCNLEWVAIELDELSRIRTEDTPTMAILRAALALREEKK
jgi:hypothetical protein